MRTIKLVTTDGKILYEGKHRNINEAIEFAITRQINLDSIDLSGELLPHINLDGIILYNAKFSGADLIGANMSEADFIDCDFSGADLTQACCCYSNFFECNFRSAIFASTDIAMAHLKVCQFEGLSVFNLNFDSAFKLSRLTYYQLSDHYEFDEPPILLKAPHEPIVVIGKDTIANKIHKFFASQDNREFHAKSTS